MNINTLNDPTERLAQIEIISFDLDDTLWPLEKTIEAAEETLYQWMIEHTPQVTERYDRADFYQARVAFSSNHPQYLGDVTAMRKACLLSLFEADGYDHAQVEQAFSIFYRARSQVTPYDGAVALLELLGEHYKVAALTNGNADLEIAGMARLFHSVQSATLDNPAKPDRAMFDRAAEQLGFAPHEILHIGDNAVADVGGGQNAGALTVWFNQHNEIWPEALRPADIELHRLSDLPAYLPRLNPSETG